MHRLRHARHAVRIHGEEHVVARDRDARVVGHLQRVRGAARRGRRERDAALVRVDRVRGRAGPDQRELGHGADGGGGEGGADAQDRGRDLADRGPGREGAGRGVEVGRGEDLGVAVVGGAGAAEAAAAVEHGGVGEQDGSAVVVARHRGRVHLLEGVGRRVPEFSNIDRGVVGEGYREGLAARDQDLAVGKYHTVSVGAWIGHGGDRLNGRRRARGANGDDVGIGGGGDGRVLCGPAGGEDLAGHGVVHDSVAAHGISVGATEARWRLAAAASSSVPVHGFARTCLEDRSVLPTEQPAMVVLPIDPSTIGSEHGSHGTAGEQRPGVRCGVVDLAVLSTVSSTPRAADNKGSSIGNGDLGLIATCNVHVCTDGPCACALVVSARCRRRVAAGDNGPAVSVDGNARTEHIMVDVRDGNQR